MNRMKRTYVWKMKLSAFLVGGSMLGFGGGCFPDNFWMTQLNDTLSAVVTTVVGDTIDAVLGS